MLRALAIFCAPAMLAAAAMAAAEPATVDLRFEVLRNGDPIGTTTILIKHDGKQTLAQTSTHIKVKIAFVTVYRFDQTETERWTDGHFVALNAKTDDNGTVYQVNARQEANAIRVDANGKVAVLDPSIIPASIWNAALVKAPLALNCQDGSVMKLKVTDHGQETVDLHGHQVKAHHYSIETSYTQDVWYDGQNRLVRMETTGSDGSKIEYQPS